MFQSPLFLLLLSLLSFPYPSQVSIGIKDMSHHAWFSLASSEKYILNLLCGGSRGSCESQSWSEVGVDIFKGKSQG